MIAVNQNIQDLRIPFRNNKKSCVEINAFTVFCVCSSNYKKILLINPFDSPFYELSKLLIFASFIDFLPSLSLQLHTGRKRVCKRISPVRFSSFKSRYMKWHFIPWNPGSTRQRLENGDHKKNQIWRISKEDPSFLRKILSTLYVEYYWFVSSDFPFVGEFFLSVVNIRRHFDWKCHRQPLLVTHLWRILLSWLQFYAVEQANCKKLQR